jgi:hypothetical protein
MKYTSLKITKYLTRCHWEVVLVLSMISTPIIFVTVNAPSSDTILFYITIYNS